MKHIQWSGAFTAIVTPFKKNGTLDLDALKNLVQYQIEGGVDGIVACGSTGEAATLDEEEYTCVVETVVKNVAGKIPVIAGAGSNDTKKAVKFSLIAKRAGADALLHVNPYYNKPTVSGLIAHFKAIGDAANMPIIMYNVPGRTGYNMMPATIVQIARAVPQAVAVKECSGSLNQMGEIIASIQCGGPKNFVVLAGDDSLALPLIAIGGHGCISVASNEVPELFSRMIHTAQSGNQAEAQELHYRLLDLMNVNFIESNPIPVKTALALMGRIEESFRLPLTPIEEKNRIVVANALKKLGLL